MKSKFSIYERLLAEGRAMPEAEMKDSLRTLAADARFAAVVVWLDRNRMNFTVAGSGQAMADRHGSMAHCMGSVHALTVLEGQLRNLLEPASEGARMTRAAE